MLRTVNATDSSNVDHIYILLAGAKLNSSLQIEQVRLRADANQTVKVVAPFRQMLKKQPYRAYGSRVPVTNVTYKNFVRLFHVVYGIAGASYNTSDHGLLGYGLWRSALRCPFSL